MPNDDLFGKLEQALERHAARTAEHASRERERKLAERARLDRFDDYIKSVIKPAMEAIGTYVEARGHRYNIREAGAKDDRGYRPGGEVTIEFAFYPKGFVPENNLAHLPTVGIRGTSRSDKLFLHSSTMYGPAGSMGGNPVEMPQEQLTPEFVRQQLVDLVTEVLEKVG